MLKCSRDDCLLAQTGICREGIDPADECPNTRVVDADEAEEPGAEEEPGGRQVIDLVQSSSNVPRIEIRSGKEMTEAQASALLQDRPGKVVALIGMLDCGKTTLLAEMFLALQQAPVGELAFAGSATLVAFDERCHKSRLASGNTTPHTPRTSEEAIQTPYLHLDLCRLGDIPEHHRIVFADISGETFEAAAGQVGVTETLSFLSRADHLVVMFDGARLSEYRERPTVRRVMLNLLYRLRDAEMLKPSQTLHVVFTKWDEVLLTDLETASVEATEGISRVIRETLAPLVGAIHVHQLAARSYNPGLEGRFGVPKLVNSWCPSKSAASPPQEDALIAKSSREISDYRGTEPRRRADD